MHDWFERHVGVLRHDYDEAWGGGAENRSPGQWLMAHRALPERHRNNCGSGPVAGRLRSAINAGAPERPNVNHVMPRTLTHASERVRA